MNVVENDRHRRRMTDSLESVELQQAHVNSSCVSIKSIPPTGDRQTSRQKIAISMFRMTVFRNYVRCLLLTIAGGTESTRYGCRATVCPCCLEKQEKSCSSYVVHGLSKRSELPSAPLYAHLGNKRRNHVPLTELQPVDPLKKRVLGQLH